MESMSRLIYPAQSLAISPKIIKEIKKINLDFIWKNKNHYIRKSDLVKNYKSGGINAIDFEILEY